jgi:hypothetical protein
MKFLTAGIWPTDLLIWMVRDNRILTLDARWQARRRG